MMSERAVLPDIGKLDQDPMSQVGYPTGVVGFHGLFGCKPLDTLPKHYLCLASWMTKSKQLPWLWRRRVRVTLMRHRRPICNHDGYKCSSPRKLQRSRQIIYSKIIQSHQEQRIFYTWALDLLYYTLRKAMKSDELTRALSKPFIPSLTPILFPRRVKRVRKAAAAYLEEVSRRVSCLGRSDDEPLHS